MARVLSSFIIFICGAFVGGSCLLAAEIPAAKLPGSGSPTVTELYLREKLALWKQRLQLDGWTVSVVASATGDLRPGTLGNIHWDSEQKTAVIRVLDNSGGQTPASAALKEMENTVVHELIHLELSGLPRTDQSRTEEEFVVDRLTAALLQLDGKELPAQTTR